MSADTTPEPDPEALLVDGDGGDDTVTLVFVVLPDGSVAVLSDSSVSASAGVVVSLIIVLPVSGSTVVSVVVSVDDDPDDVPPLH